MVPTAEQLEQIAGFNTSDSNVNSIIFALDRYGKAAGLDLPHRLAHYLSQTSHESGGFKYDQEIASGAAYEGRKDLGNTQPGDGKRFKGRSGMQITGRANYRAFTLWCRTNVGGAGLPDFEAHPEAINTDPWEGLVPIWFWSTHKLNAFADENNIEQITKKINGGRNGLSDRIARYTRAGLVLLGYGPTEIAAFQRDAKADGTYAGKVDNDDGPKTRSALHMTLAAHASPSSLNVAVKAGPVVHVQEKRVEVPVEVEVEKPVVPKGSNHRVWVWPAWLVTGGGTIWSSFIAGDWQTRALIGGATLVAVVLGLFLGEVLIRRAKALIQTINGGE